MYFSLSLSLSLSLVACVCACFWGVSFFASCGFLITAFQSKDTAFKRSTMARLIRIQKEIKRLQRDPEGNGFTDMAVAPEVNPDGRMRLRFVMNVPPTSRYADHTFVVNVQLPPMYPFKAPEVIIDTRAALDRISEDGELDYRSVPVFVPPPALSPSADNRKSPKAAESRLILKPRFFDGRTLSLSVSPKETVGELKARIAEASGMPWHRVRLFWRNKGMALTANDATITELGLRGHSHIDIMREPDPNEDGAAGSLQRLWTPRFTVSRVLLFLKHILEDPTSPLGIVDFDDEHGFWRSQSSLGSSSSLCGGDDESGSLCLSAIEEEETTTGGAIATAAAAAVES
jgi:ubiquitin-protein ligase